MSTEDDQDAVTLDELLDEAPHAFPDAHRPFLARFTAWVAVAMAAAIGVSAVAVGPGAYAASLAGSSAIDYWDSLPTDLPLDQALPQHTILLDRDGQEFARFFSENRIDVPLDRISPHFTNALIATEDARFRSHGGVDPIGIMRALQSNAGSDSRQGASTITQQLVQNLLMSNAANDVQRKVAVGTSYDAKLREVKYAVALEDKYSKDEILHSYANAVYFGNSAYGIEAAAKIYFNTTAEKLTLAQAATLVGILKGPAVYDPVTNPKAAQDRRNTVLARMAVTGTISEADAEAAASEELVLTRGSIPSGCEKSRYPFYCSLVRTEILTNPAFGKTAEDRENALTRGGMTLTTALDRKAMDASQKAVVDALGYENRAALGTATIVPGTGHISAVAQNRQWGVGEGQTELVYAAQPFQPGSSMKPLVLATALEQGIPASRRLSASAWYTPPQLDSPPGGFNNYGANDYGVLDARGALRVSSNTYFIRMIELTGVLPVADMAARLGITTLPRTGDGAITGREASLALGAYEVTPLDMANAYATFAAHGVKCTPVTVIAGKRTTSGTDIPVPDPDCHQAVAPAVADTVADALKHPLRPGGSLENLGGVAGHDSGAKTGTTNDFGANWTVGITAGASTAVWLGDPRGAGQYPLYQLDAYGTTFRNLTGSEVAAPVWKAIMEGVTAGTKNVPLPRPDDAATSFPSGKTVPDVRGMSLDQAVSTLIRNGLDPVIDQETAPADPLVPADVVIAQTPGAGSSLGHRQQAVLTLSHGSDINVAIPEGP